MGEIIKGLQFNIDLNSASEKELEEYEKRLEQQEKANKQAEFEQSGVGRKYWNKTLDEYDAYNDELKNNLESVKKYIQAVQNRQNKTLWLCGNSGTGKTFLAAMIVRNCGGRFVKSYQIEDDLEVARDFKSSENKKALIKRYAEYPLLIIDEIAKFEGRNEIEYLFRILNERYENEVPTVLVTNKSKKELKEYIGKPLYDRFIENCTALEFNSSSYRINERAN